MQTATKYGLLLASALLAAAPSYASSINSFTFNSDSSPFTSVLVENMSGSQAVVSGTVECLSKTACSGEVGTFTLGVDLTGSSTPVSVDISGVLSGSTGASGSVDITTFGQDYPFSVATGSFNDTILSLDLPALGQISANGALDLSLAAGQSITLPLTINVGAVSSVPEPSGQVLLLVGLLGLAGIVRYRSSRIV